MFKSQHRNSLFKALSKFRNVPYDHLRLEVHLDLTCEEQFYLEAVLKRLELKEPITKILGETTFYGFPFKVTPDVLDPRPDSETLIDVFLKLYPDQNQPLSILELGIGSGCLLLTLLKLYPNATGVGIDLSEKALLVSQENALALGVIDRVEFRQGRWFDPLKDDEIFDCLISNPPYIETNYKLDESVLEYDPHLALFGGEDGLEAYEAIIPQIHLYVKDYMILEIGFNQKESVRQIISKNPNLLYVQCFKDYGQNDRVIVAKVT